METAAIRLNLRDAALLASVDGDYDAAELSALQKISDAAGLKKKNLSEILDWVSKSFGKWVQLVAHYLFGDAWRRQDSLIRNLDNFRSLFYGYWCELTGIKKK